MELHQCATDSERELNEATAELSIAQDKVEDLEASLCEARSRSLAGATTEGGSDNLEVGQLIRDLEDARDDALEGLGPFSVGDSRMKRDFEYQFMKVRESMREELELKYRRDINTHDELIELLKAKVSEGSPTLCSSEHTVSVINGWESHSSGGWSNKPETGEDLKHANHLKLPALPKFSGDDRDDVDSLKRWLAKLVKHAELQCWTEREKLVKFELHLARIAEQVYEVLPSHVKENYVKATEALQERLKIERPWC